MTISGSLQPYKFDFSVVYPIAENIKNSNFTKMEIQISNANKNLYGGGSEIISIYFTDLSVIRDFGGNIFAEQTITANLNQYEYLSEEQRQASEGVGASIKFTIISLFSVNMLTKILISTSASFLWAIIHVMQALRYILLINVKTTKLLSILLEYIAIVAGDIEELETIVPNIFTELLIDDKDIAKKEILYVKFKENGYESPLLIEAWGAALTIVITLSILTLPTLWLCK